MTAITIGEGNAGNRPEHRHTGEADHRQPELPVLDAIDPTQIGEFEEADGGGDHDCRQRRCGKILQQVRARHQQQRGGDRAHDSRHLRPSAGGLGHRRAR